MRLVFSARARADRRQIAAHTLQRFGVAQAKALRTRLERTLKLITDAPSLGAARPDLDPPGRSFRYVVAMRTFVIVYEPTEDQVRVVRILHGARHLVDELRSDGDDDDVRF